MKASQATHYLALLRGINVGGNNIIKMVDLKACFGSIGFTDVVTYIQSGNVLFKSDEQDNAVLTNKIEEALSKRFDYKSKIVLVNYKQLEVAVKNAPKGFGSDPDEYRYDVFFVKPPLIPAEAFKTLKLRDGVDYVTVGDDVLYFSRLISKAGQSYMAKIITQPIYKSITIRNWNTTSKLFEMMSK